MRTLNGRDTDIAQLRDEVERLDLEVRRLELLKTRRKLERTDLRSSSTDRILMGAAFTAVVIMLAIIAN